MRKRPFSSQPGHHEHHTCVSCVFMLQGQEVPHTKPCVASASNNTLPTTKPGPASGDSHRPPHSRGPGEAPLAWLPAPPRGKANASVAHCHSAARSLSSGSGLRTEGSGEKRWNAAAGSGVELPPPAALPYYGAPAPAQPPPRPAPGTGRGELAARSGHAAAVNEWRAEPGGHGEESAQPRAALRRASAVVGYRGCRSRGGGGVGRGGAGEGGGWPEVARRLCAAWPRLWCSGDRRAGGAGTGGCVPLARRWVRTCLSPRHRADTGGGQAGPGSGLGRAASPVPALSWAAPRHAGPASPRRAAAEGMEPPGARQGCHGAVRPHEVRCPRSAAKVASGARSGLTASVFCLFYFK